MPSAPRLAALLLVPLLAGSAAAEEPAPSARYLLEARELPGQGRPRVELTLEGRRSVVVTRRVLREDGSLEVWTGRGRRFGPFLTVRYERRRGTAGALAGDASGPSLTGRYLVRARRVWGIVSDPARTAWRWTYERGARAPAPEPDEEPFERLVLCLDGVPYDLLRDLHARGHFAAFDPPSRMVTVFPSLSNPAWEAVLGLEPGAGYQVIYYSRALGRTTGSSSGEMLHSYFESRMHHRSHGAISHSLTYVLPYRVGGPGMGKVIREAFAHRGSKTAFAYLFQTDAIAHMNGPADLERALLDVEAELDRLMARHRVRTGRELEVAVLSDHGHTLREGQLVDLGEHLEEAGWEVAKSVERPDQVSFTSAGILGVVALYCQEEREADLARAASRLEGVDVCTYDVGGRRQHVVNARGEGRFDYDPETDAYGYVVVEGEDPLGYAAVYEELGAAGKLDRRGYARATDLFAATAAHPYPDAPHRIRVGHTTLVRNPADVIVSLRPGFENGLGFVKAVAGFRGRNGTHGGLAAPDTNGVLMTNFLPPLAAVRAEDVREHLDLSDYHRNDPALELQVLPPAPGVEGAPPRAMLAHVRVPAAEQAGAVLHVSVYRQRLFRDRLVWRRSFRVEELPRSAETFTLDLAEAAARLDPGADHLVRVQVAAPGRERELELSFEHEGSYKSLVLAAD